MPSRLDNSGTAISCTEFRILVQQILDGIEFSERCRQDMRRHRNRCVPCCNFHDQLLQLTAVATEVDPPEEFCSSLEESALWSMIVRAASGLGIEAEPPAELAQSVKLFDVSDAEMDDVFDRAMWARKRPNIAKAIPLGRLDGSKAEADESQGRITDLGKFLFDSNDDELIVRLVNREQPNMRVERVSENAYAMLIKLQDIVRRHDCVVGTMVLASDGTVVSARFEGAQVDQNELGVWIQSAYHNALAACKILGHSKMMQMLSRMERGYVNIANLQGLTLVTLMDADEDAALGVVNEIASLMRP